MNSALVDKVAGAAQGYDSLGPTGLVVYLTAAERDAIVDALRKADNAGRQPRSDDEKFLASLSPRD